MDEQGIVSEKYRKQMEEKRALHVSAGPDPDCNVCKMGIAFCKEIEDAYVAGRAMSLIANDNHVQVRSVKKHIFNCCTVPREQRCPVEPDPITMKNHQHGVWLAQKKQEKKLAKVGLGKVTDIPGINEPMPKTSEEYIRKLSEACWWEFQQSRRERDKQNIQAWARIVASILPSMVLIEPTEGELRRMKQENPEEFAVYVRRWLPAQDPKGTPMEQQMQDLTYLAKKRAEDNALGNKLLVDKVIESVDVLEEFEKDLEAKEEDDRNDE